MAKKTTKKVKYEVENVDETPFVEADPVSEEFVIPQSTDRIVEEEISIFVATIVNLSKPKRILEVRKYSDETTQKIYNVMTSEMTYDSIEGDTLTSLKNMQGRKFDFILFSGLDDLKYLTAEFKLLERLISRKGMLVIPNSISSKHISSLIQYTARYGYKASTLETTAGNGISLIHRNY